MPMNVTVDDRLIGEALRLAPNGREDEVVSAAIEEEIRRQGRLKILELEGTIDYYPDYDYKAARRRDSEDPG